MGRAARLKRERKDSPVITPLAHTPQIRLENPVSEHFASFIVGNAQHVEHVVEQHSADGQHLVLCGAGPSLAEHAAEWCPQADQVWGCNSALTWLASHGHKVTHGFTCDQTPMMLSEWESAPDVEYLLASTVHPHLWEYLMAKGRTIRAYHNFVGLKRRPVAWKDDEGVLRTESYEDWLYMTLFAATVRAGSGLNAVTRAIDVARYMGFRKITVLGADCHIRTSRPTPNAPFGSPEYMRWVREDTVMHADGGSAIASDASPLTMEAEIDPGTTDHTIRPGKGRRWVTKIDLVVSAIWLKKMVDAYGGQLEVIGDTLTNALAKKSNAFLSRLPSFVDEHDQPITINVK